MFQTAYRAAKRETFQHAITKLQKYASRAAEVFFELMTSDGEDVSAGVKLGAARTILDVAASGSIDDLAAEVEEIKRAIPEASRPAG